MNLNQDTALHDLENEYMDDLIRLAVKRERMRETEEILKLSREPSPVWLFDTKIKSSSGFFTGAMGSCRVTNCRTHSETSTKSCVCGIV